MSGKNEYWIADPQGVKAKVSGVEARDYWVRVNGWTEADEPTGQEFQWVRNEAHGGKGVLNHEAALLHEDLGCSPPGPEGYDEPSDEPAAKTTPSTKSAASATSG